MHLLNKPNRLIRRRYYQTILVEATLLAVFLLFSQTINYSHALSFQTPSEYFLSRMKSGRIIPSPSRRNPTSLPYMTKAQQRITSQGGWNSRYVSSTPSTEQFMYDGTLAFDTFNLDYHPYVMDIGCTRNGLYIRPIDHSNDNYVDILKSQLIVGNVLVSTKKDFDCHDHSLSDEAHTDEKVLYRVITKSELIYSKENGISYFELETSKVALLQLFSKLKLLKTKPIGSVQNGPLRFQGSAENDRAFEVGWNVQRDSKGNIIYNNNVPSFDQETMSGGESFLSYECTECFFSFYAGYAIYLETDLPWHLLETATGTGFYSVRVILPSLTVSATALYSKQFELLPNEEFFSATFVIGPVPVQLSLGFGLDLVFILQDTASITFTCNYVRGGSAGFQYYEGSSSNTQTSSSVSGGFKIVDISVLNAMAKVSLEPTLSITFYELFPIIFQINPYLSIQTVVNPTGACLVGLGVFWGIEGVVGIGEIEIFGHDIWDGKTFSFDIVGETEIESLSGICILKAKRSMGETLTIASSYYFTDMQQSETVSDSSTVVSRRLNITSDIMDYFDGVTLNLGFNSSCQVSFGTKTFEVSRNKFHISFEDFLFHKGNNITVLVHKTSSESVSIGYSFKRNHIPFGESKKIRAGLIELPLPSVLPGGLAFKITAGTLKLSDGTLVGEMIQVTKASFPLKLTYAGPDAFVTIYPIYAAKSGQSMRHVFDGSQTNMAIMYTPNTGVSNNLHSFVITPTYSVKESVSMKVSTGSSFQVQNLLTMPNPVTLGRDGVSLNSIPNLIYVEVLGTFTSLEVYIEPLEVYIVDLSSDLSYSYNTVSSFALSVSRASSFGKLGVVIELDSATQAFIGNSLQTEQTKQSSLFVSSGSRKNVFGFSPYYHKGLMKRSFFVRVESREVKKGTSTMTSGTIKFSQLKNENITVSVKFTTTIDGQFTDDLDTNLLQRDNNIRLCIIINDPQYSFNSYYLSGTANFVKFINTLKTSEQHSNWNDIILPNLSSQSTSPKDLNVSMPNPQTMLIKLPVIPELRMRKELVSFTKLSPELFVPQPLRVTPSNSITSLTAPNITPGDVAAIVISVVGFVIIVILLVSLITICYFWRRTKKSFMIKDAEMAQQ